jgi:hypothetical protein
METVDLDQLAAAEPPGESDEISRLYAPAFRKSA